VFAINTLDGGRDGLSTGEYQNKKWLAIKAPTLRKKLF
jgi:hypothetical protein